MIESIFVTLVVGILVAIVSQLVGHYLQLRRDRLIKDCDDDE